MALSLTKGANASLTSLKKAATPEDPGLDVIVCGLGWDVRTTSGEAFDLDSSVVALDAAGHAVGGNDGFVYFNQLTGFSGAIRHSGDNLTGAGEGDDEQIEVRLNDLPPQVESLVFPVTVYDARARGQNFGMVRNAFARVFTPGTQQVELARFDLTEDSSTDTCIVLAKVYRRGGEWKFAAVGQGYADQAGLLADYRIVVG
jgi:tellurium resistance protein TerD